MSKTFKTPMTKKTNPPVKTTAKASRTSSSAEDDALEGKLLDEIEFAPPSKTTAKPKPKAKATAQPKKKAEPKLPSLPPSPEPVAPKKRKDAPTTSTTTKKKVIRKDPSFDLESVGKSLVGKPQSVYKGKNAVPTAKSKTSSKDPLESSESDSDAEDKEPKSKAKGKSDKTAEEDEDMEDDVAEEEEEKMRPVDVKPKVTSSQRRVIAEVSDKEDSPSTDAELDVTMVDPFDSKPIDTRKKKSAATPSTGKKTTKPGKGSSDTENTVSSKRPTRAAKTRGTERLAEYNQNEIDIEEGGQAGALLDEMITVKSSKKETKGAENEVEQSNGVEGDGQVELTRLKEKTEIEQEIVFDGDIDFDTEAAKILDTHDQIAEAVESPQTKSHAKSKRRTPVRPAQHPTSSPPSATSPVGIDQKGSGRFIDKDLILRLLIAKLEGSKSCDWYELSRELNKEGSWDGFGGKGSKKGKKGQEKGKITGDDLYELYHFTVLPALKAGRALWVDDPAIGLPLSKGVEEDHVDLESEEEAPVPSKTKAKSTKNAN